MDKQPIDFASLLDLRKACNKTMLNIVGGKIPASGIAAWLKQWDLSQMPWRLWEWVSDLKLEKDTPLPATFDLVEHGRLFGQGGDLALRRDGVDFYWRFVGPKTAIVPSTPKPRDFWQEYPNKTLHRIEQQAILWGAWQDGLARWYDDRVGWAGLNYPQAFAKQRNVYVHYYEYLDAGRVAFVWMHDLGDKKPDPLIGEANQGDIS